LKKERFHRIINGLAATGLAVCVLVTLAAGFLFMLHPREWADFVQVMYLVRRDFREPLSVGSLMDGAISGIAGSTGDKYTYFLPPDRNRAAILSAQGYTGAIGITVDGVKVMEDRLLIREVRPDSGAANAGLRVDDGVLRIEDTPVLNLTVDEAVALIRGLPDTWVRLLVAREGEEDREYNVKRTATITLETVEAGFLRDEAITGGFRIAYVYIDYFAANTGQLFNELLDEMLEDGAEALIVDLRFNGGGDVMATSVVAGRLLPDGELLRLVMRDEEMVYRVREANPISIPYVVLVNGGSASASEILAGAVQDRGSGILIGARTYGKGSVQSLYHLPTGSGLRVTEGLYYLPGGRCIDGEGIIPDYVVENNAIEERDDQMLTAAAMLQAIVKGDETVEALLAKSPLNQN